MKNKYLNTILVVTALSIFLSMLLTVVYAIPIGPEATSAGSSTRSQLSNTSINESTGGGYIYTYTFSSTEQNSRWKAYVGNVTGTLALDDANNFTIYQWDLGTVTGEVYATRNNSIVSWTNINCSWAPTGNFTNRTVTNREDVFLEHTRLDNISATFSTRNHSQFQVGTNTPIPANDCYSLHPYVNDTQQTASTYFDEVLLYDGTDAFNGKVVYAALVEIDISGYNGDDNTVGNATFDFQMLVPERGSDGFSSSTAYYFYVELT